MKLPKDTKDWHEDLITAASLRLKYAVHRNKRDQFQWRSAVEELQKSKNPVFIQKGGENKGTVKGIPEKIGGTTRDKLIAIVKGEEPVDEPKYHDLDDINLMDTRLYRDRKYRDSSYGILAAMYVMTRGDPTILSRIDIIRELGNYHDGPADYDFRTRQQGAFKAMDSLVAKGLVKRNKDGMSHKYNLTVEGFSFCYHLFTEKFHPNTGPYQLVTPRYCSVTAEGVVVRNNSNIQYHYDLHTNNFHFDQLQTSTRNISASNSTIKRQRLVDYVYSEENPQVNDYLSNHNPAVPHPTQNLSSNVIRNLRLQKLDPEYEKRYNKVQLYMHEAGISFEEAEIILLNEEIALVDKKRNRSEVEISKHSNVTSSSHCTSSSSGRSSESMKEEEDTLLKVLKLSEETALREKETRSIVGSPIASNNTSYSGNILKTNRKRSRCDDEDDIILAATTTTTLLTDQDNEWVYNAADFEECGYIDEYDDISDTENDEVQYQKKEIQHSEDNDDIIATAIKYSHTSLNNNNIDNVGHYHLTSYKMSNDWKSNSNNCAQLNRYSNNMNSKCGVINLNNNDSDDNDLKRALEISLNEARFNVSGSNTTFTYNNNNEGSNKCNNNNINSNYCDFKRQHAGSHLNNCNYNTTTTTTNDTGTICVKPLLSIQPPTLVSNTPNLFTVSSSSTSCNKSTSIMMTTGAVVDLTIEDLDCGDGNNSIDASTNIYTSSTAVAATDAAYISEMPVNLDQTHDPISTRYLTFEEENVNPFIYVSPIKKYTNNKPSITATGDGENKTIMIAAAIADNKYLNELDTIKLLRNVSKDSRANDHVVVKMLQEVTEKDTQEIIYNDYSGGKVEVSFHGQLPCITENCLFDILNAAGDTNDSEVEEQQQNVQEEEEEGSIVGDEEEEEAAATIQRSSSSSSSSTTTCSLVKKKTTVDGAAPCCRREKTNLSTQQSLIRYNGRNNDTNTIVSSKLQLALLMDRRERKTEAFYRKFYHDLNEKLNMQLSLPPQHQKQHQQQQRICQCKEEYLSLGDFHFAYELRDKQQQHLDDVNQEPKLFVGDIIIELKALSDIVSRSAGESRRIRYGTAAHMVQEKKLRMSPMKHSFMLLEGDVSKIKHIHPLVWGDQDLFGPDVLLTATDIRRYMVAIIARNYGRSHRVGVLVTHNNTHTVQLLTAIAAVIDYNNNNYYGNSSSSRNDNDCVNNGSDVNHISISSSCDIPTCLERSVFDKYINSWGGKKRGRESQLRNRLSSSKRITTTTNTMKTTTNTTASYENTLELNSSTSTHNSNAAAADDDDDGGVHEEMIERIVRRFGDWDNLMHCYYSYIQSRAGNNSCSSDNNSSSSVAAVFDECSRLLDDLVVGGSNINRNSLVVTDMDDIELSSLLHRESVKTWDIVKATLDAGKLPFVNKKVLQQAILSTSSSYLSHFDDNRYTKKTVILQCCEKMTAAAISDWNGVGDAIDVPTVIIPHHHHHRDDMPSIITGHATDSDADADSTKMDIVYPWLSFRIVLLPQRRGNHNSYAVSSSSSSSIVSSVSSYTSITGVRRSHDYHIVTVSGLDVVEALVNAVSQHRHDINSSSSSSSSGRRGTNITTYSSDTISYNASNHREDVAIVHRALQILLERFPSTLPPPPREYSTSSNSNCNNSEDSQIIVLFEGLALYSNNTGAMKRLSQAVAEKLSTQRPTTSTAAVAVASTMISLGPGRQQLNVLDTTFIDSKASWMLQLIPAVASLQFDWQCFLTRNSDESKLIIHSLIIEAHRQAMLII